MSDKAEVFEKWYRGRVMEEGKYLDKKDELLEAFIAGWVAAGSEPANTAEAPAIQHILSRDQRDALVAANVLLAIMQNDRPDMFNRIQPAVNEISDMLYEG